MRPVHSYSASAGRPAAIRAAQVRVEILAPPVAGGVVALPAEASGVAPLTGGAAAALPMAAFVAGLRAVAHLASPPVAADVTAPLAGGVVAALPLGHEGLLDSGLPLPIEPTLYTVVRDWLFFLMVAATMAFSARERIRLNTNNKSRKSSF